MITNVSSNSRYKRLKTRKSERKTRWPGLTYYRSKRFRRTCRIWMPGSGLISPRNVANHRPFKNSLPLSSKIIIIPITKGNNNNKTSTKTNLLHQYLGTVLSFKTTRRHQEGKLQRLDAETPMLPIMREQFNQLFQPHRKTSLQLQLPSASTRATARRWSITITVSHPICQVLCAPGPNSSHIPPKATSCSSCSRQMESHAHKKNSNHNNKSSSLSSRISVMSQSR